MKTLPAFLALAGCGGGAALSAGTPNNPSSPHQGIEIGAHAGESSRTPPLADEERIAEPERPLGGSREEQAFAHVHASAATCSGVLVGERFVFTSRRCTGGGRGARGHEGDLRVQIPRGPMAWSHLKVEAWVAPSCAREVLDVALLVLEGGVEAKPLVIASVPDAGARVQSPGYGSCGETRPGMRSGTIASRGSSAFRVDAALCLSDLGAPILDAAGNAIGIVIRAGHESGTAGHDDSGHDRRHTADAIRLDASAPRELLERARRVLAGDASAVDAPTSCD